ncbi:developmentally-regulated GTP-binding protein 2 isoform X2 [Balaenoptera musculus]|uniref:Developmentally-regulated GTP-binding protein 2 isoform X2 n=1 Tax=Balaenoptera musculus TaxID=9771 RepID=A0A8B8W8V0_BALMU|nr:developmentally-regulated GTP-binding protein 2 isoform X2 [Balaenoptera musculus]
MGILEKISEIEKEIARTQKNKATEYHLGLLKAKLAKYRAQLLEPSKSSSSKGEGFDVMKSGDARVALIGFPSVGKSTFLSLMTSTASEAASYEFTTLTCIPGVIEYKGANIQLLDLPGIIEGAAQGKGRGRQVIAVARTADVVIMMLDATKGEVQRSAVGVGQADSLGRPCGGNRTLATTRVSLSSWWVVPGVLGPLPRGSSGRTVHGYTQCRRPGAASPRGLCLEDGAVPCHPGSGSCLQGPGCPVAAQSLPGARPQTAEPCSRPGLRLRAQQASLHPGRTPADLPSDRPEGLGLLLSTFGCWEGTFGGWWRVREGRPWRVGAARPAPGTCEGHGGSTRSLLEKELGSVGIRLNKHKPNIYFKPKKGGGISFNSTVTLTQCSEKLVQLILHEYKIFNAEVLFREDCSPDEFIDVIMGNRVYMPCLYVYNKIDQISMEEVDRLARKPDSVVISCGMKLNLDYLLEMLWEYLALTCIYTKKRGQRPDFTDAIILRKGASVEHVCHRIHRSLASQFKYALVWGTSTKYSPQRVGLTHTMEHEDVIQIVKK